MGSAENKRQKTELKRAKKEAKAGIKAAKAGAPAPSAPDAPRVSPAVRYAEFVRGALYVLLGASLVVALVLGQRGAIVSLDDLIDSLFVRIGGKLVLALIGIALFIYGLKHLRLVR